MPVIIWKDEEQWVASIGEEQMLVYMDIFDEAGHYGNGPEWEGFINYLLSKENPALLTRLDFDSEASNCLILAQSREDVYDVAKIIQEYCSDKERLLNTLREVEPGEFDF